MCHTTTLVLLFVMSCTWAVSATSILPILSSILCASPKSVVVSPFTGAVYAACGTSGALFSEGSVQGAVLNETTCSHAVGVALSPSGQTLLIACDNQGVVAVSVSINNNSVPIRPYSNVSVVVKPHDCSGATAVVFDTNRTADRFFVFCQSTATVLLVVGGVPTRLSDTMTCTTPQCLAYDASTDVLFIASGPVGVVAIAVATSHARLVATAAQCPNALAVTLSADGSGVYVACDNSGVVLFIRSRDFQATPMTSSTSCASALNVATASVKSGAQVVAACGSSGILSIGFAADGSTPVVRLHTSSTDCSDNSLLAPAGQSGTIYSGCAQGVVALATSTTAAWPESWTDKCQSPDSFAFGADGVVYASCSRSASSAAVVSFRELTELYPCDSVLTAPQCLSPDPIRIAVSTNAPAAVLYASCGFAGLMSISPPTDAGTVISLVSQTQCPRALDVALESVFNTVYVVCADSDGSHFILSLRGTEVAQVPSSITTGVWTLSRPSTSPAAILVANSFGQGGLYSIEQSHLRAIGTPSDCSGSSNVALGIAAQDDAYAVCATGGTPLMHIIDPLERFSRVEAVPGVTCGVSPTVTVSSTGESIYLACGYEVVVIQAAGSNPFILLTLSQQDNSINSVYASPWGGAVYVQWTDPFAKRNTTTAVDTSCGSVPGLFVQQGQCSPCPMGTARPSSAAFTNAACTSCSPGSYAATTGQGRCTTCPAGYICPERGTIVVTACSVKGAYCPEGSASEGMCPAGYFCPTPATIQPCPAGQYCRSGSTAGLTCAPHTYCPPGSSAEQACPVGSYCPTPAIARPCEAGFFCVINATAEAACSLGSYCPPQSTAESSCQAGFFCPSPAVQAACDPSYYCPQRSTNQTLCPAGSFCSTPDVIAPCSLRSYCGPGSTMETLCPAGFFCSSPSVRAPCDLGNYCPSGTISQEPCPAGSFCASPSNIVACKLTEYCPAGTVAPALCPAASFCPSPATRFDCQIGTYCPQGSVINATCPSGSACATPASMSICQLGSYCPAGSVSEAPCPAGFACVDPSHRSSCALRDYCPAGSTAAALCPVAFFCPDPSQLYPCTQYGAYCGPGSTAPLPCAPGGFCPNASTRVLCDPGYYNDHSGSVNDTACNPCNTGSCLLYTSDAADE